MLSREVTIRSDSRQFATLCEAILHRGLKARFSAQGRSMEPNILDGDTVIVAPVGRAGLNAGDIALVRNERGLLLHRVIGWDETTGRMITRGDTAQQDDSPAQEILGRVVSIARDGQTISLTSPGTNLLHRIRIQMRRLLQAGMLRARGSAHLFFVVFMLFGGLFLCAQPAMAQFTISDTAMTPPDVLPGGTSTFTQVLTATANFTPSNGTPAKTTQAVPTNAAYASYTVSGTASANWTCALATGTVTCRDGSGSVSYNTGNTTTVVINFTASPLGVNGQTIHDVVNSSPGGGTANATVTIETPDLSMTQSASPNPVATGANITYTETVTNNSGVTAAGSALTQNTPTNTTFVSLTAPIGWTCGTYPAVGATGTIGCTANAALAANSTTGNFSIVVRVISAATVGSSITNTAAVSETLTDPNPLNNTTTTTVTVSGADLSMTQTGPTAAAPNTTITYVESVTNNGPDAAVGATLYQQTPVDTTFSSIVPPTGWTCGTKPAVGGTGQVICTATGNINSGVASGNFTYVVTVNSGTAAGTTIVNTADVTSETTDSNPANNTTTTSTLVEISGDADLAVSMTASPTPVFVSSTLTYTITVQDLGLAAGSGVTVTDTLPSTLANPSVSSISQGSCGAPSGGKIVCTLNTVAYPTSPAITITITGTTPGTAGTLTNSVTVATTGTDPVSSNNTATVLTVVQPLVCALPGNDGAGGTLSGIVNAYYPPASTVGTANAGSTSIALGAAAANGAQTPIAIGDLLLIIQMQAAQINSTDTSSYGSGVAGQPFGSTSIGSSGEFEFVTAAGAVPVTGGTLTFTSTGTGGGLLNTYTSAVATSTQGAQTFQVIRVPQYTSATLSSNTTAMAWNGATGGVLALDVASQLTLGGTVALDGMGFRGGGGIDVIGSTTGANTDTVTTSPATLPVLPPAANSGADASKGEGIAGTPHWIAPALSTITPATTAVSTGQTYVEGLPNGSFARGGPGNAGGGATDANPSANNQNSGGGGGANGGQGGTGGFGWNSAGIVGGYGGAAFPTSTSAIVMGGGGGAGTSNDGAWWDPITNSGNADCGATCTGIYSSGAAGGGIVIIRAGSVTGTGTITANGQNALAAENDGGGGAGAGGSVLVFANSGNLTGLTANAMGGNGGDTWPEDTPGTSFPGNRHGPGGGGGGVIFASSTPVSWSAAGGLPGLSTLANDAYGAMSGTTGQTVSGLSITESPGTQSGAYCSGSDLGISNSGTPNPVVAGNDISYTQNVTSGGPQDALNAAVTEQIPANTTFQTLSITGADASGWSCTTPAVNGTGSISCTNPDVPAGASGAATFNVAVKVNAATASGTEIADTVSISSGTNDPNLTNNSATVLTVVGAANSAYLTIANSASPNPVLAGMDITYNVVVTNNGPGTANNVGFTEYVPANTSLVSAGYKSGTSGWTCSTTVGTISCTTPTFASGGQTTFQVVVMVNPATVSGTIITDTANLASTTTNPNPSNTSSIVTVVVATAGQADLAVTKTGTPTTVLAGNDITYVITVTNNGPATAASAVLTDILPGNTSFVSMTQTSGSTWICPAPSGGTLTCMIASFPAGTSVFKLILQVTAGTAPGTTITNSVSVSSAATDPYSANNTASASSTVASPSQADVSIIKTASPQPVDQGTNLTYILQVTSNGPAVAQNVTVSDPLPSQVTFASVSTTQGTCTQTGGTVSCSLGSMSVGGLAIITINVNAASFSSTTTATNTATVSTTSSDPNLMNNSSTAITTIVAATAVQLSSFNAIVRPSGGVLLEWQTQQETRNLGFHIYREDAQGRHQVDPSLIAGSALLLKGGQPEHHGKTYQWIDPQGTGGATYWLEDVDLNGTRTTHGPVTADGTATIAAAARVKPAALLNQLNRTVTQGVMPVYEHRLNPRLPMPVNTPSISNGTLDEMAAVKISVTGEGWYRVTRDQLVAAGLDPHADARRLQLYAEGVEQPILILGTQFGPLRSGDSIEFFGTGIDTPYSGTRVYWLVEGSQSGGRIKVTPAENFSRTAPQSFPFTLLFEQRTTYFAALLNGENSDNFFGALITTTPTDQYLVVTNSVPQSTSSVQLTVTLQGVTEGQDHAVSVMFNGVSVGEIDFSGQANVSDSFSIDPTQLQNGTNTVTLTALDGENDVSLVQSITLGYPHSYTADSNWLQPTAPGGSTVTIGGFTNAQIQVFDVTNPLAITQLSGRSGSSNSGYSITVTTPGNSSETHTLLAFSADQITSPAALSYHAPSSIEQQQGGTDAVIITNPDFSANAAPLMQFRESQGHTVDLVTTDQIFDAFNYGERSPYALRSFLQFAQANWRTKPQSLLLLGGASFDPRDYLGFGYLDFVPTRMIETAAFETSSDDWFSDFNGSGFATIPTGRIPARTTAEADLVISKILNYEQGRSAGDWQNQALVIADQNAGADFTSEANSAINDMPKSLAVTSILANGQDSTTVAQQIDTALNNGALIVNYTGHGSEEQWSFTDLFDDTSATNLTNSDRLPVFLLMDCLNGFFHDVYAESLSTALLMAPNGGAVAVWASSGFTSAPPQGTMDRALLSALSSNPSLSLGSAILQAKAGITDPDVRRTWILFGDPTMTLPLSSSPSAARHR